MKKHFANYYIIWCGSSSLLSPKKTKYQVTAQLPNQYNLPLSPCVTVYNLQLNQQDSASDKKDATYIYTAIAEFRTEEKTLPSAQIPFWKNCGLFSKLSTTVKLAKLLILSSLLIWIVIGEEIGIKAFLKTFLTYLIDTM